MEIPHEAKTGTGPILLTCSFPYVRDWLNEHQFRNEPCIMIDFTGAKDYAKGGASWSENPKNRIAVLSIILCIIWIT